MCMSPYNILLVHSESPIYHAVQMEVKTSHSRGESLIKTPVEVRIIIVFTRGSEVESHILILT